jgi:hypothetical protein
MNDGEEMHAQRVSPKYKYVDSSDGSTFYTMSRLFFGSMTVNQTLGRTPQA